MFNLTIPYLQVDKFKNGVIGLASFIELYHNLQDIRLLNDEFKPYSTDVSKYDLYGIAWCGMVWFGRVLPSHL